MTSFISGAGVAREAMTPPGPDPKSIAVVEVISDKKIQQRLSDILLALGPYEQVKVNVLSGVVILSGLVNDEQQIDWVQGVASRMDGVVAVQNQLTSPPKDIFDLSPAQKELDRISGIVMRHLPAIILAIFVLTLSFFLFFFASFGFRRMFAKKISSPLLLNATAKMLAVPVFLIGLYLALRISGLAGLAFTVLGGTRDCWDSH